jgi:integral membrane protein (TIGR01906 family)
MPGFPQDRFGFTLEDRIYWSSVDLKYLVSERGIEYFEEYRLESGEPMHNSRELRHMEDVKVLLFRVWRVWGALSLIALGSLLWLLWKDGWTRALDAISTGAIWTLILIGAIAVGILFAFGVLFVGFHRIFFEGDTWLFLYSDTFIRLYPERFWRDTFILLASVNMLEALILLWLARWTRQRVG